MNFTLTKHLYRQILFFVSIALISIFAGCLTWIGLVSAEKRTYQRSAENPGYSQTRSFLKAKKWFQYRLEGTNAKIRVEDQETGKIAGTGFFSCRVPYGVGEVDVEFHEFSYEFQVQKGKAEIEFREIKSYSLDPNDIVISYGPRNEREATVTIRMCFEPLVDDLFGFIL
jgi:hypothetical protein